MKKIMKPSLILGIFLLTVALFANVKAQTSTDNMKMFFDSEFPGIKVQVTATNKTQPGQNITVILDLQLQTDTDEVYIQYFNLSIFGFLYGENKAFLKNETDSLSLNSTSSAYNCAFNVSVPANVWGLTYGEIVLSYSAKYGIVTLNYLDPPLLSGFATTYVENIYLKNMEELLDNLNNTFLQSFGMNLTLDNLAKLNETYSGLQANAGDLDNTRRVVAILAVTTVFFVATTVYMAMRKPREYL